MKQDVPAARLTIDWSEVLCSMVSRRHLLQLLGAAAALRKTSGAERAKAPDFQLQDASGVRHKLSDFRGQIVLLNFWATWCAPCRTEIPLLGRVQQAYAKRGFTVLGVAMDERGWAAVTPFLVQQEVDYPVLLGNPTVARSYGGLKSLPRTFFLDRSGRIVASQNGVLAEEHLRRVVEIMLAESPAKP